MRARLRLASAVLSAAAFLVAVALLVGPPSSQRGRSGAAALVEDDVGGFPPLRGPNDHAFAPEEDKGEGEEYADDPTAEQQAAMHLEWDNLQKETSAQLKKRIAAGEEADKRLHDSMALETAQDAAYGIAPSPSSLPLWGTFPTIRGDHEGFDSGAPKPCSLSASGCPPPPNDIIVAQPQALRGPDLLVDPQVGVERRRLAEEGKMEARLRRQGMALSQLRARAARRAAERGKKKTGGLWSGVDLSKVRLPKDSKRQRAWEKHLWAEWDRENHAYRAAPLADQLRAARQTEAAGGRAAAADRAGQAEAGEADRGARGLYWERDPRLHYRDLGPDGKRMGLKDTLVAVPSAGRRDACAQCVGGGGKAAGGGPRGGYGAAVCQFCGGGPGGDERDEVTEHGGEVDGEKVFTREDWARALRGADFVHTFPDASDLRVLDWLGAEKENPSEPDSMSAKDAQVPLPADWDDFPKARGTYTTYGVGPVEGGALAGLLGK